MCGKTFKALRKKLCAKNVFLQLFCFSFTVNYGIAQVDSLTQISTGSDSTGLSLSLPSLFHQTAAIDIVSGTDLQQLAIAPVGHIIQGQAAGVWSMQTTAQPAGLSSLWIRGYNSSMANNQPFIILDGIPLYHNESIIEAAQISSLSLLNPFDIASIEIIKDGSAARYGMRGFNGVMLINTKQGQKGKSKTSFHSNVGLQKPSKLLSLMNAQQYANFVNEFSQRRDSNIFSEEQIQNFGEGTNWQKELFSVAPVWQHHLSASGGAKKTQYYLSGSYLDQQGVVKNSDFKRYTLSGNLTHHFTSRLSITPQINYTRANSKLTPGEVIDAVLSFSPTVPVKDSLGNYHDNEPFGYSYGENPMELVDRVENQYESSQLFGKVTMGYQVVDSLFIKMNLGKNLIQGEYAFVPEKDFKRLTDEQKYRSSTYLIEPTISYHRRLAKHALGTTIGYAFQKENQKNETTWRDNTNDRITSSFVEETKNKYTTPFWADFSYQYDKRYVLMLSGRYETYRYGVNTNVFSPAVALAWHVHRDPFFQQWSRHTELTFRTSFGNIKKIYPVYTILSNNWFTYTEKNRQWNAGMDMSLFNKRINFSVDAYQKKSDNLLISRIPAATGYGGDHLSLIEVLNRGLEFALSTHHTTGNWIWNSRVNLATVKNQVIEMPKELKRDVSFTRLPSLGFITEEGIPVGSFYGYLANGLFTTEDEVNASDRPNAQLGDLKFLDISGGNGIPDGTINYNDATALGHAQPSWQAALHQYVGYHRWSIEASFYASIGNETLHFQKYLQQSGSPNRNQNERMLYRWSPERPESTIPARLNASTGTMYGVENASFLRLRHIRLSYQFPLLSKKNNTQLYLSAQNLFTFTSYQGYDPEVSHFGQNVRALGVDYDSYPRARTFSIECHFSL